ncbi:MAG: competence/damage-inducible protein A [candidate division WOR-3 bacterium]
MRCEIIIVGDEVLLGRVVDTNSALIAQRLEKIGISVSRVIRVGDDKEAIKRALAGALVLSRLIFVAGGLGPTPDDKTLDAVCELLERKVLMHEPTLKRISAFFEKRGLRMPEMAKRQAFVPEGAAVFENPLGMVPGMVLEHQGGTVVLLPGVPQELEVLLDRGVLEHLKARFAPEKVYHSILKTFGVIESRVAPKVIRTVKKYPLVSVGFYPSVLGVDLLFSGRDEEMVNACADDVAGFLKERVYAREEKSLAEVVGGILKEKGLTLATAESCTGGLVGDLLTNVPGSSEYYLGGVVAYSNRIKMKVLGVRERTLENFGAVSAQCVREMALGVCRVIGADAGIAVSGIAGPGGGTKEKPVGLVYIGVAFKDRVKIERRIFSGTRRIIKERSGYGALDLLRRVLTKGL